MKVDKVISNIITKNSSVKKGLVGITALTTATALFTASKEEGIDSSKVLDEYYRNEFAARTKTQTLKHISRFTPEERLEFLHREDDIKLFPNALFKIVNAKNDDNLPRFNAEESLMLFDYAAENIEKYSNVFKTVLAAKDNENKSLFNANDCVFLMDEASMLNKYLEVFASKAKTLSSENCDVRELVRDVINIGEQEKREREEKELRKLEMRLAKLQERKREKAMIKAEKEQAAREATLKRAEQNKAEQEQIKQEKMLLLNKQVGWIEPDVIFNKVNAAVENKTHLVLENGEILPDEIRDKMAGHIKEHPAKARKLINARYYNLQPMFSEKESCEIISELDSYFHLGNISALKSLDDNGEPFFNSEQCRKLMQIKYSGRNNNINSFRLYRERKCNAEEIVEVLQNYDATICSWTNFDKFFNLKDENGEYKYSVSECIAKTLNDEDV